jgi:hypothetical protein
LIYSSTNKNKIKRKKSRKKRKEKKIKSNVTRCIEQEIAFEYSNMHGFMLLLVKTVNEMHMIYEKTTTTHMI